MKPIFSKIRVLGTAALALFLTASCSDILDEQPRSSYAVSYTHLTLPTKLEV